MDHVMSWTNHMQASKEIGISITDILCCKYWFYGLFKLHNFAMETLFMVCGLGEKMDFIPRRIVGDSKYESPTYFL